MGRHSGLHGLKNSLQYLNIHIEEKHIKEIYQKFLEIADKKKVIYDTDLIAIVSSFIENDQNQFFKIEYFSMFLEPGTDPKAVVSISYKGKIKKAEATGDGPINAIFSAISSLVDYTIILEEYHVTAISPGTNALGEAVAVTSINNREYVGRASSTNILEASAQAFIHAINHYELQ